jgi:hypothetical protein
MRTDFRGIALWHKYPDLRIGHDYELYNDFSDDNRIFRWLTDSVTKPSDSDMTTWFQEWTTLEYARNRAAEYPSNGDQWDMIYKDNLNGTTTHKDAVEAVKTKWPKDNSGPIE